MSIPRLLNTEDPFNSYKAQLSSISNIKERFNAFDQITTQELTSPAFEVLLGVARDPQLHEACMSEKFTLGFLEPVLIIKILEATNRCKKLSDEMMSSMGNSERNSLWPACRQIETYIDSKICQTLGRIILAKNFLYSSNPKHPLHPIYQEMWKFQSNNHGSICGCYTHIQTNLHFKVESPHKSLTKMTQITVKYNTDLASKLFIRGTGPGMSWDKGVELKNEGNGEWAFKTHANFGEFELKILRNDSQWEKGLNHKLGFGKKVEIKPNF